MEDDDHFCRICFDSGPDLFAPCSCDGSSKYVHRSCLDQWRNTAPNRAADLECMECRTVYMLECRDVTIGTVHRAHFSIGFGVLRCLFLCVFFAAIYFPQQIKDTRMMWIEFSSFVTESTVFVAYYVASVLGDGYLVRKHFIYMLWGVILIMCSVAILLTEPTQVPRFEILCFVVFMVCLNIRIGYIVQGIIPTYTRVLDREEWHQPDTILSTSI